jgi:SAM-dependent methyltransferase
MKPKNWTWRQYMRVSIGTRLSHLGERIGCEALIYNRLHFWHFHEVALESAPAVIEALVAEFPEARRWADVGCGSGAYAAELARRGKSEVGCEYGKFGRKLAARQGVDCRPFDLSRVPPAQMSPPFDVAYCFEVIEHVPEALSPRLLDFLVSLAPVIVFTGAQPGQGGTGHINEKPRSFWLDQFTARGLIFDGELTDRIVHRLRTAALSATWLEKNLIVVRLPSGQLNK